MDDNILIKAHLKGDKTAFEVLVKKHQISVSRLAYSIMKSEQGVSDVVQEVFLCAFRGLSKFRGDASFKTWLYRITVHETMRYLKKKNRWHSLIRKNASTPDVSEMTVVRFEHDKKDSPEHRVFNSQKKKIIQNAMSKLGKNHRIVLHLHYQEDLSIEEIAAILEIPSGSVKSRLYYARLQLKELLSPFFEPSSQQGKSHVL